MKTIEMSDSLSIIPSSSYGKCQPPYLECKSPDGRHFTIPLKSHFTSKENEGIFTFGRSEENNFTINDPQMFVSREHCRLKTIKDFIWLYDDDQGAGGEASQSGTFVRPFGSRKEIDVREEGNKGVRLHDGDTFFFVGKVYGEEIAYWEFTLNEESTRSNGSVFSPNLSEADTIVYSWELKALVKNSYREIIALSGNQEKLITYMVNKNYANKGQAIPCSKKELKEAIWNDPSDVDERSDSDLAGEVYRTRQKIESNPSNPKYLQNIPQRGYILYIDLVE